VIDFDPNNSGAQYPGLFALPYSVEEAAAVIVPAPWDATSSQNRVASGAPDAVFAASRFVELYDPVFGPIYEAGIAMDAACNDIAAHNQTAVGLQRGCHYDTAQLDRICERVNAIIHDTVAAHLRDGKRVGLLGGDHSVSYGSIRAHLERYPDLGVLQIDAHCDLRPGLDGVRYSHASIMYNVIENLRPASLVQVGVRGLCEIEADYVRRTPAIETFFDAELRSARAGGETWSSLCDRIVSRLPDAVYVSFDIDGLEPAACPGTGTPVPGGLSYNDALFLLHHLAASGKSVVGFDLVEVGTDAFDAGTGAHLLYQLCGALVGRRPVSSSR
jgi:agmatinase